MPWLLDYGPAPKRVKLVQADGKPTTTPTALWNNELDGRIEATRYRDDINRGDLTADSIGWAYPSDTKYQKRKLTWAQRPPTPGCWMLIPDPDPETNEFGEVAP